MNKSFFTIMFMVTITALFIAALAVVNEVSMPQIQKNQDMQQLKSMMYAFDLLPEGIQESDLSNKTTTDNFQWDEKAILEIRQNTLRILSVPVPDSLKILLNDSYLVIGDSAKIFVHTDISGQYLAYGFPLKGMGLWGTISAFAVVSADLKTMIGIDFTEQMETPGLGARITEQEFKYFFRNLDLSRFENAQPGQLCIDMVRNKAQTNVEVQTHELQAITGATQTCDGVLKMVNIDLMFYLALLRGIELKEYLLRIN